MRLPPPGFFLPPPGFKQPIPDPSEPELRVVALIDSFGVPREELEVIREERVTRVRRKDFK